MHNDSFAAKLRREKRRLLAEVRGGSELALARLLEIYRPFLRVWARRPANDPLRNKFETSDVIQETNRAALQRLAMFQSIADSDFSAKLKELLRTQISASRKHYWRARKRQISREKRLHGLGSANELARLFISKPDELLEKLSRQQDRERVAEVLATMNPADQEVIRLRLWQSLGWEAIGERQGCTSAAARMRFKRAVANLAMKYRQKYPRE